MKPIRGTTRECFEHLDKILSKDKSSYYDKRKIITDFCQVTGEAYARWLRQSGPAGEVFVRLQFYLEFLGYIVEELQGPSDLVLRVARIYAFGVVTMTELANILHYSHQEEPRTSVYRLFRGVHQPTDKRLVDMRAFVELYEPEFEEIQQRTEKVVAFTAPALAPAVVAKAEPTIIRSLPKPAVTTAQSHNTVIAQSFVSSVGAIRPLAEVVLSDAFSPEERDAIREQVVEEISDLSRLFTQLSAETTRNALRRKQQQQQ